MDEDAFYCVEHLHLEELLEINSTYVFNNGENIGKNTLILIKNVTKSKDIKQTKNIENLVKHKRMKNPKMAKQGNGDTEKSYNI